MNGEIGELGKVVEVGLGIAEKMQDIRLDSIINNVFKVLGKIDPNVLKVLLIIAVLVLIVSIIKKTIQLAVVVVVLALIISLLMPYINNFNEASIDSEGIQIQIENTDDIGINKP